MVNRVIFSIQMGIISLMKLWIRENDAQKPTEKFYHWQRCDVAFVVWEFFPQNDGNDATKNKKEAQRQRVFFDFASIPLKSIQKKRIRTLMLHC